MKSDSTDNARKPSLLVYFAVVSAQMCGISLGSSLGWSAPAFEGMNQNGSRPHLIDEDEDNYIKSWIGSSLTLGATVGAIFSGLCIELLGRKKTLILVGFPFTAGWVLLCVSKIVALLIVGRVITGLCCGIILGTLPTYVAEISTPNIRGFLGMAFNLFVVLGILYVNVMALWMPWHYISIAALLPTILLTVSMIFMPESPNWLMIKFGRGEQVVEALQRLRRDDSDIDKELDELEERANISKQGSGFSIRQIGRKDVYKPLLIGMCLVFFQQFCGMNAVQFYMTDMFRESGSKLEPLYDMLITNAAMLVATVFGGLLIDRLGRKILLYISGFGHMSSIAVLGYYYFKNREVDSAHTEPSIVPILCLIVFVSSFSIGYGPIPWIIVTEITSSSAIGFIITTTSVFAWIFTFLVTKEFVDISKIAGKYGALWMFSCISALSIAFAFYLPETKGKSVEEIQKLLYPEVTNSNNQNNNKVVTNL